MHCSEFSSFLNKKVRFHCDSWAHCATLDIFYMLWSSAVSVSGQYSVSVKTSTIETYLLHLSIICVIKSRFKYFFVYLFILLQMRTICMILFEYCSMHTKIFLTMLMYQIIYDKLFYILWYSYFFAEKHNYFLYNCLTSFS